LRPFAEHVVARGPPHLQGERMRILRSSLCLLTAAAIWLSTLHVWFDRPLNADALADRQLLAWQSLEGAQERQRLRRGNPEWDLMTRMFTVLGLVNWMLEHRFRGVEAMRVINHIVDTTLAREGRQGMHHFLLPYGRQRPFRDPAGRSLFVDGEIALMLAARQIAAAELRMEQDDVAPEELRQTFERDPLSRDPAPWIERVVAQIERAPALLAESYPDEAWIFCNAVALAAVRLHDAERGTPEAHAELTRRWVANARRVFVDHHRERSRPTHLLVSSTSFDGRHRQGPEGSTLWLAVDMLRIVDETFAREQYTQARRQLIGRFAGFAWGREWPDDWPGDDDVDSGPTVPLLGASAGSSGLALVAARSFGDEQLAAELFTSLSLAGFPLEEGRYAAGNLLADAVVFYARSHGPLWQRARARQVATGAAPAMAGES
jgi:Linalool dehydratase/isomerase